MASEYTGVIQMRNADIKREDVISESRELLILLDGDLFYPMRSWPRWVEMAFWKKPISDEECFKVMLFFIGNGCPPDVIGRCTRKLGLL